MKLNIQKWGYVINWSSRGHTETLQGHLKLSGSADDDGWRQGLTRTQLKLWCFATWCSLVLNLDGWRFGRFGRFGWDREEFRRDTLCRFQTEETYMKFWMYKYWGEHIRVIGVVKYNQFPCVMGHSNMKLMLGYRFSYMPFLSDPM